MTELTELEHPSGMLRGGRWPSVVLVALVLAAGSAGTWWYVRSRPSDRRQIEHLLLAVAASAEHHQYLHIVHQRLSADYWDGGFHRGDLAVLARGGLRSPEYVGVTLYLRSLQIEGDRATAQVSADLVVHSLSESARRFEVALELRREPGGWKILSARGWQDVLRDYDLW